MSQNAPESSLESALTRLRADRECIPWPQLRALAQAVAENLRKGSGDAAALPLLYLLVEDRKWEVRLEAASALVFAPDDDFTSLIARLANDPNAFVRKAADTALTRRRKVFRENRKRRRGVDLATELYEEIRRKHGETAAEKALEMAEQRCDQLAGAIVHDLRTVLTGLADSSGSLAAMSPDDVAGTHSLAAEIVEEVAFLERYTKALSDYAGALPPERRPEQVRGVVASAETMARARLQQGASRQVKIAVKVEVPADMTLEISRELLVVALAHVITNAFEAIMARDPPSAGGEVKIEARVLEDEVRITVQDNGIGLSDEQVGRLMTFQPGRKDPTTKEHSAGLGLPTASRYVRAQGGSLTITGEKDVGATVTIALPLKQGLQDEA